MTTRVWTLIASGLIFSMFACDLSACDRGHDEAKTTTTTGEPSTAKPSTSASASVSASAAPTSLEVSGSYESKLAAVRTPSDAPKFKDEATKALGAGTLSLTLPAGDGPVVGKANGALGDQSFSGNLEGDDLTGTVSPASSVEPVYRGVASAKVTGHGASRVVTGSLRVSGRDGRVVREAAFTLQSATAQKN